MKRSDARREGLAAYFGADHNMLRDAGHNPSPEILHRIATTLEASPSTHRFQVVHDRDA